MFPVSNPDVSHPSGIYLGPIYFTGCPVVYDQFIGPPALPNPHIAVFGYSGSGKSVTLKTMASRSALIGERIVILDLMGEYESIVLELLNGKVVHIAAGRETGINPLEIEAESDDRGRQVGQHHDKVAEIRALFTVISRAFNGDPLQAQDAAILEEAVREEYASREYHVGPLQPVYQGCRLGGAGQEAGCQPCPISDRRLVEPNRCRRNYGRS